MFIRFRTNESLDAELKKLRHFLVYSPFVSPKDDFPSHLPPINLNPYIKSQVQSKMEKIVNELARRTLKTMLKESK